MEGIADPQPPKKIAAGGVVLICLFLLVPTLLGGIFTVIGVRGIMRAHASTAWPTAEGVIVESAISQRRSSQSGGGSKTIYAADIVYEYVVGTQSFVGERVGYDDHGSSDSSRARSLVKRYPVGSPVAVHYFPEEPSEAVLEPGVRVMAWLTPGVGSLFFLGGLYWLSRIGIGLVRVRARERAEGRRPQKWVRNPGA